MRLRSVAAALLCAAGLLAAPATVQAQKTTITGSNLKMGGIPIPAGTVTITPTNAQNYPVGIGSADGDLSGPQGYTCAVAAGSITGTCQVPDLATARATVPNTALFYRIDLYNSAPKSQANPYGGYTTTLLGVQGVTGATWSLNGYAPPQTAALAPTGLITSNAVPSRCTAPSLHYLSVPPYRRSNCVNGSFVQDAAGLNPRGLYSGSTTYAFNDVVSSGGSAYVSLSAGNVGNTPATSPANWALLAARGDTGATGAAGGLTPRGSFDPGGTYAVKDLVRYTDGNLYYSVQATGGGGGAGNAVQGTNVFNYSTLNAAPSAISAANGAVVPAGNNSQATAQMYVHGAGTIVTNFNIGFYDSGQVGIAEYDASHNFIRALTCATFSACGTGGYGNSAPPNSPVTIPSDVYYIAMYSDVSQPNFISSTSMVIVGSTLPGSFVAYTPPPSASAALPSDSNYWTMLPGAQMPWFGKNIGYIGDSYLTPGSGYGGAVTWAVTNTASLGGNLALYSAWPGRTLADALNNSGNTGQPAPNCTNLANIDLLYLALGTNLSVQTVQGVGSASDAPSNTASDTFGAQLRYVLNALHTCKPTLRIIWVAPNRSARYNAGGYGAHKLPDATSLAILSAVASVGKQIAGGEFADPVMDMWTQSGINAATIPSLLLWEVDSLHLTQYTATSVFAPLAARMALKAARQ